MKLLRVGSKGKEIPAILDGEGRPRDVSTIVPDFSPETLSFQLLDRLRQADSATLPLLPAEARIGAPLSRTGHFIAIGLNYADHAAEGNVQPPPEPIIFTKAPNCLSGPNDPIPLPRGSERSDWEVELAVIIGERCYEVDEADALSKVFGYAVCNDVSERHFQMERAGQWLKGKSSPGFGPLGPWIVTADEIADPQHLPLFLELNGERMQDGNTAEMIFSVAYLIAYASRFFALEPGDIITTGTPAGVGMGKKPPRYLKAGDQLRLGVSGLGEQRQTIVATATGK